MEREFERGFFQISHFFFFFFGFVWISLFPSGGRPLNFSGIFLRAPNSNSEFESFLID